MKNSKFDEMVLILASTHPNPRAALKANFNLPSNIVPESIEVEIDDFIIKLARKTRHLNLIH